MKKLLVVCGSIVTFVLFGFLVSAFGNQISFRPLADAPSECHALSYPTATHISKYGRRVAEEFLSSMTSMFVNVYIEWVDWDQKTNMHIRTGQFTRFRGQGELFGVVDYEPQGIIFVPVEDYRGRMPFYHGRGNRIYEAPWIYVRRESGWTSYHFAEYFRLFDFDGSGIPIIFIHFMQTFQGGYAGFYRIFRYIDGEYRMLEMKAVDEEGELLPWWRAWIGRIHEILMDSDGRLITFIDSLYHGLEAYEHLILTDSYAKLHYFAGVTGYNGGTWLEWQKHHWPGFVVTEEGWWDWSNAISWLDYHPNPTIFGTNITLERVESLVDLEQEIENSIRERLGLN